MTERHNLATVAHFGKELGEQLSESRYRPRYELGSDHFSIYDPNYDTEELIGDEPYDKLLVELAHSDALRRLQTIEQLTLPQQYATIPHSYYFSRWEHVWGSAVFTRRMARVMGLDPKESMYLQLKVLLSDFKHTAFSHAGDWLFQGEGGPENDHENRMQYASTVGITALLQRAKFEPARVFDDSTHDITDAPSGMLDVDRIDYTRREANRWVDQSPLFGQYLNADSFTVKNGQLVAKDAMAARMFALSYTILVTKNWQEPVHRLQLNMFLESLKRVFVARNGLGDEWATYSPRDLLGTADHTILGKIAEHDDFMSVIDHILRTVSRSERDVRWRDTREVTKAMIEFAACGDLVTVDWVKDYYDRLPSNLEISKRDQTRRKQSERMVIVPLDKLRKRTIDPLFINKDGNIVQLSQEDPEFSLFLQTAISAVQHDWDAGIIQNKETSELLKRCLKENKEKWPVVMKRPRLSSDAVRSLLRSTVESAQPYASQFVDLKHV